MSHINVKNLECLCVKDATAKNVDAQGGVFKAKMSGTSNLRTSRSYGYGKLSSPKSVVDKEFRYRVTPPPGSNLEVDSKGPIYRIYVILSETFEAAPPLIGDTVVLTNDSGAYEYIVYEYIGLKTLSNGVKVNILDIEYSLDQDVNDPSPINICDSLVGYTCIATLKYTTQSNPIMIVARGVKSELDGIAGINGKISGRVGMLAGLTAIGEIASGVMTASYSIKQKAETSSSLMPTYLDKFAGSFGDYKCVEKLYPSGDLDLDSGMQQFVGPSNEKQNLYTFIDEGVFTGDYHTPFSQSVLLADDANSFIHPSGYHTEGNFQYKSELTDFHIRPDQTRLRIRASAPMANYESKIAPLYTIKNVTFSDPSGNAMVQYEDINILGDVDYSNDKTLVNYATYSLKPITNKFADQYDWERRDQPHTHQITGYQLSFEVKVTPRDDAFDPGFDEGFEEDYVMHTTVADDDDYLALDGAPLSTQGQSLINPTKSIRISAIEICNSGGDWLSSYTGPRREDYFNLFLDTPRNGRRLEKKILPSFFALADASNSGIFPAVSSVWQHKNKPMYDGSSSILGNNLDTCGSEQIVKALQTDSTLDYAELHSTGPHFDSGKMIVKFGYGHGPVNEIRRGAFGCEFDQNTCPIWFHPSGAFQTERKVEAGFDNNFLAIESITLKVKAKKAADSRDYVLDIVGWSDDKLLNITKAPSGFLQNPSSVQINGEIITSEGTHPVISGYYDNDDDLALSTRSISEREKYLETSGNLGGDHYSLTRYPIVNTTDFADYEVPLKVYKDDVEIGLSRNYNVSSMLEHLYLDIYPLPSGAAIASAHLLVRYAPQAALQLEIQGGECFDKIQDGRSEGKIFPSTKQGNDSIINAGSGYGPLSTITNIPHAYSTPSSIKSNYSRRWRGLEGTVQGPYDTDAFGFGFYNPLLEFPLLSGFYNFDYMDGKYVQSRSLGAGFGGVSGLFNSTPEIYKNVGWRFKTQNIFSTKAPNHTSSYKTTDWTALSSTSPAHNFEDHELYGMIADALDNVVRISGHNQNVNFGNIDASGGFSIFTRFTPDIDVSGTTYDLFSSGVLFSKWTTPSDMDFALGYKDGYLCGYAKATDGTLVSVQDTVKYSGYQYPLSVILTYNDHESEKLKLYTDNEFHSGVWTTLRASSSKFTKHTNSANLIVGHSDGSGVGMNMLLTEFGISTWNSGVYGSGTNIVETNADATYKQVTAQKFLENHRVKFFEPGEPSSNDTYKLWDYVNEDTQADWALGDFKTHAFSSAFSHWTKRAGKDLISFHLKHSGIPYENQSSLSLNSWPSTISSGVSYHTQIENDFLRFHLSDTSDNFHSVAKRITKSLPIGYNFKDKALVVETVLEHRADNDIQWPECKPTTFHLCNEHKHAYQDHYKGPRLVVSLYTKKKEPYWTPNESNWGLINRSIHYIQPSSYMVRLDSKFDYQNLIDDSEQWALFPAEPRLTEFTEKYYSQDVDDMFLQYDLVYPSGGAFDSNIDIHSAHVRMDEAFVKCTPDSGIFNLYASGCTDVLKGSLDLHTLSVAPKDSGILNLNTFGPVLLPESGFELNVSGSLRQDGALPLRTVAVAIASDPEFPLHTAGCCNVVSGASGTFNLVTKGKGISTLQMPLSIANDGLVITPSGGELPLYTYAPSGNSTGFFQQMQLRIENNLAGDPHPHSGTIPVYILGGAELIDRSPEVEMPLVVVNNQFVTSGTLKLTVYGDDEVTSQANSSSGSEASDGGASQLGMNLYVPNYGGVGSTYLRWYNQNYGTGIQLRDNSIAAIPVSNEIRGVDLIGYGACDSDSPRKAIDPPLVTDETIWRPETCNDGGIFRAVNTYTNSGAINFAGETGYSGNYYGFRKYTGLIPNAPYYSTLKITTGSTDSIQVPRDFEEWEYGICGPNWRGGDQGDGDCDSDIVYSGVKLIGDYPYLSGNLSITPISGRNPTDNYGEAVAVTSDLMVVGSPKIEIPDASGHAIPDAGSLFLYRRGQDVAGEKSIWTMEDKLMLPSGFRRDYVDKVVENLITFDQFTISGRKWNIGQEGRLLGSSVDIAKSGDRETIVAGAPFAGWSRRFPDITTSGIPMCMVVFVDKFTYNVDNIKYIKNVGKKWEHLYKYFSAPWNAQTANEFQPNLNVKCLILQLTDHDKDKKKHPDEFKDFFSHTYIPRMDDQKLVDNFGARNTYNSMLSGIIGAFREMFPPKTDWTAFEPHSGIPPIVGIFKENSHSTLFGKAFQLGDEDVVDDFVDFYKEYSHASGVVNPEIPVPMSGHTRIELGASEKMELTTASLINNTLNSGYLIDNNIENTPYPILSFITSGVGQKWAKSNAAEFQIPPSSGGRVFVFEKESGTFNCVQEIIPYSERQVNEENEQDAPDDFLGFGKQYNDRFGHSVAISKNSDVISVGSPWTYVPCEIFERQDAENQRMYNKIRDWLVYRNLEIPLARYDALVLEHGADYAKKQTYHELSQTNKLWLRTDKNFWDGIGKGTNGHGLPIELYKPIFNYKYGDITTTGTWQFIQGEFLGSSRLGYSTSVDDDGITVAFGAPTDSTTMFEDSNVWYNRGAKEATFASYTNAGAVRMFEAKQYVSHSGAVEFTRFGNLDRSVHHELREAGFYDRMGNYFQPDNIPFTRLPFSTIEIPRNAGLAFIITPELDAASDEIIDNIKNWLALGDRTLVLVGNDPLYEEDGLYRESNDIVNKILKRLGSRMKIEAADTEYESLPECISETDVFGNRWNVTKSFVPENAYTDTYESKHAAPNMFAKGVGKIVYDVSDLGLEDLFVSSPCDEDNQTVCNLPIKHLGDLRAQWNVTCAKDNGMPHKYKMNWPFHFTNSDKSGPIGSPCRNYPSSPKPLINRPWEDVVPILTAAEWTPDQHWFRPEETICETVCDPIWEFFTIPQFYKECKFATHQLDTLAFSVSGDFTGQSIGENIEYWRLSDNKGGFINPDPKNGRDAILQGIGDVKEKVTVVDKRVLLDKKSTLMVEEPYLYKNDEGETVDGNNRVFILASVNGENERSFTDSLGGDDIGGNSDQNIVFYVNTVRKSCEEAGRLVQLGGWTKRTSFKDAYEFSVIKEKLTAFGINVTENEVYGPGVDIDGTEAVDTVWIANPDGMPTDDDISVLKNWLKNGNKKLFITYAGWHRENRQGLAENVSVLLEKLGLKSRPWLRPCKGDYFVQTNKIVDEGNRQDCCPYAPEDTDTILQKLELDSDVFAGCLHGYAWDKNYNSQERTSVQKVSLRHSPDHECDEKDIFNGEDCGWDEGDLFDFIPISGGGDYKNLIWYDTPELHSQWQGVYDICPEVNKENLWYLDCKASGQFPVNPGSGYRVFVNWVSETKNEIYGTFGVAENVFEANAPCAWDGTFPQPPCDCHGIIEMTDENVAPQRNLRNGCWYNEDFHDCGTCDPNEECGNCRLGATTVGNVQQSYVDVKADQTGKLRIIFDTDIYKEQIWVEQCDEAGGKGHDPANGYPQTARILSISGCPLPLEEEILNKPKEGKRIIGWDCREECETIPAEEGVIPGVFRPIMHRSEEYCNPANPPCPPPKDETCCAPRGDEEIEDGPIVAAEEYEHFTNGANGFERSKIVVLTDSTMIQGQCKHYRNDSVGENQFFIRSLYPVSPHERKEFGGRGFDVTTSDKVFQFTQKLRAPERGSAPKYYAAKGVANTLFPLYGANGDGTVDEFVDNEDTYHPANDVGRPADPSTPKQIDIEIKYFGGSVYPDYGGYPRFSGDFLNQLPTNYVVDGVEKDFLVDAGSEGGVNDLMKVAEGRDFLDFDSYNSGCPGDLFGFSVDLTNNKLIVGTPFNGLVTENVASGISGIVQWHEIENDPFRSGVVVSQNGGAGAAFYFEKTGSGKNVVNERLPWEFRQKIKPSSINIGLDGATISTLQTIKGDHHLNNDFALNNGGRTDKFGYSVAIDADMIAIGAPHHDYETLHEHIYSGAVVTNDLNTAFQRKSFGAEFDIPSHKFYDLGSSGIRVDYFDTDSGTMVLNHGAVFNYRHSITDWQARTKEWVYAEKLFSHGYHARSGSIYIGDNLTSSGCENDSFGRSVSIFRSERGDSDYTLAVGSPFHDHATSGNHHSSGVTDAGAAFTYDAMLRGQIPSIPNSGSWIDVKIFGAKTDDGQNMLLDRVYQNETGDPITHETSGIVFSNAYGDLYIEASGFDPSIKGFVTHRPFVECVIGDFVGGESANGSLNLITSGKPVDVSGHMSLMLSGAPSAYVYNSMNLRTFGASGVVSDSGLPLIVTVASGSSNQSLNLNVTSTQTTDNLNLRLRGK